jgi:uncharacterized membrane-anchored protein
MSEHLVRHQLNAEFHARPPLPLNGSTRIRHLAFLPGPSDALSQRKYLDRLLAEPDWVILEQSDAYCIVGHGDVKVRWEQHTEFSSFTLIEPLDANGTAKSALDARTLQRWIVDLPGEAIVTLRIDHRDAKDLAPDTVMAAIYQSAQQMVVSRIVDGKAWVFTDFQFVDGEVNFLLIDDGMTQRQAGRTAQRLWEIETYRLMALLGLPVAKKIGSWLRRSEQMLASLTDDIGNARSTNDEHAALISLSNLAAEVENSVATTAFRFGASRAYSTIVMQRIDELREERISGFPTLKEFMERRLAPSMNTCSAMATRQEDLSSRVARCSQLLRARIDIALEQQNQQLMVQMNQRAKQQLHLQETVEGLSVVAISYYGAQLVHAMSVGAMVAGVAVVPEYATAISIPLIALLVWGTLRYMRRRLSED